MNREKIGQSKHKAPKFRELKDDSLRWEEKVEIKKLRRKKRQKRANDELDY